MEPKDSATKPALARITVAWYVVGFALLYFIISPGSVLGYVGLVVGGLIVSNILPAIVAGILKILGLPTSLLTNIGRINDSKPWQDSQ